MECSKCGKEIADTSDVYISAQGISLCYECANLKYKEDENTMGYEEV